MTAAQEHDHADPLPRYGSLYGPLGVLALALSGTNLFLVYDSDGQVDRDSLWDMLHTSWGTEIGFISLLLIFVLAGLCAYAAVRPVRSIALPVVIAGLAFLGALMLMFKIGWGDRNPPFDDGAIMLISTAWGAVLLGLVHAIHLAIWRRHNH
ncbi:hypothetical protein [Ruania zhangjianzhongii]|uniref:hypothetical protein n=1 Tax=Ruania zhangjianzhongii TaxID=2603206 RepID=UPI0011CA5196|nr:hypothetical protein [Ruania zhangjianzhongii]